MRRRTKILVSAVSPLCVIALLLAMWALDSSRSGGEVLRNVDLDGRGIGGLGEDQVARVVREVADDFADTEISIRTPEATYQSTARQLGLVVDEDATVTEAMDVGRDESLAVRPLLWGGSFLAPREAPLRYRIRDDVLLLSLVALQGDRVEQPREPEIVGSAESVEVIPGRSSQSLDPEEVGRLLLAAAEGGEDPISVSAEPIERRPRFTDAEARQLADELAVNTGEPLTVIAGDTPTEVDVGTVRSWLFSEPGEDALELRIDEARVAEDLAAFFADLTTEPTNATFTVNGDAPQVIPSATGVVCCTPESPAAVLAAVEQGASEVAVGLVVTEPEVTTDEANAYGIVERVGTTTEWQGQTQDRQFTTYHSGGQPRVENIHRIADLIRGQVVPPGEQFSVNEFVGERTSDKGFVNAPVIYEGEFRDDIGGGVSQFATTMFNAAFFAGLDLPEYQSHSIYIDRYPYGREATLSFPNPDLVIGNNTPYGLLIWTSYTSTSITVSFYSTQFVSGQETGQSESSAGPCTQVSTERTRTYVDGRTDTDSVSALYRPGEGIDC